RPGRAAVPSGRARRPAVCSRSPRERRSRPGCAQPATSRLEFRDVNQVLNVAAYLFTEIERRAELRTTLLARASEARLRGTVLLAPEGITLFLAGAADSLRGFLDELRTDSRFAALEAKESWSSTQPFQRLLVKLKNEIIR